jgi:hypothetical protein
MPAAPNRSSGSAATHTVAVLRTLALAILRLTGHQQIIRTLLRIAADRSRILPLLAFFLYRPALIKRPCNRRACPPSKSTVLSTMFSCILSMSPLPSK